MVALQRLMDSRTIDTALIDTVTAKLLEVAKDQQTKAATTLDRRMDASSP
ncbi:MAG: hypothetical protein R3C59_11720 [Planctomycetaceae bacterium]